MKKTNSKPFLIIIFVLVGIFSLFFISNDTKVLAQVEDEIVVETTGYSILSASSFVFGGYYSGNFDKKPFTTYFEFKKDDSNLGFDSEDLLEYFNLLDEDKQETIKIVRDSNVEEYNDFYSSPELQLFSTYFFRAVGYFNDNPDQKFYGNVLSIRTGVIPYGATSYPFTVNNIGVAKDNTSSVCTLKQTLVNGVCKDKTQSVCDPKTEELINNVCKKKTSPVCDPKTEELVNGVCKNKITPPLPPPPPPSDTGTGLVKCTENCGFYELLDLINRVIDFILFKMVVPIAAIMFAYAGFELVTSGGSTEKKSKAKSIFTNVAIGLIIAVAAFLIVQTILSIVGYDKSWNWFGF